MYYTYFYVIMMTVLAGIPHLISSTVLQETDIRKIVLVVGIHKQ